MARQPIEKTRFSRNLRRDQSFAEGIFWYCVRARRFFGLKFKRQVVLGPYIADFYCHELKLIVELDGGQHVERAGYDASRTQVLERMGYRVVRFWNNEVIADMGPVLEELRLVMLERQKKVPSPYPLPPQAAGEGRP